MPMATTEQVHPLRLSKNAPASTPSRMASSIPRALSEISPAERRRNSPSWVQPAGKKMGLNTDSSPFQSSPLDGTTSPRLFWQNRDENSLYGRSGSPSPNRRSSIERLQKASRVKNSNILALEHKQEYDPARAPQVERPLAKVQGNAYGGTGIGGYRESAALGHRRTDSESTVLGHRDGGRTAGPLHGPAKTAPPQSPPPAPALNRPTTPSKDQPSPTKSALSTSRFKSSFDNETIQWPADMSYDEQDSPGDRSLHRHTKSVTFDAAPPQVNEYEMATPDLSSVGTSSREGSYESTEDDDEYEHYAHGDDHIQEDSFDASLEDTDKTPVVGPDDWRQSPDAGRAGFLEDPFEASPMPEAAPARPQHLRAGSTDSVGDHRPLPPLPPADQPARSHSGSPHGLASTAERMLGSPRGLPSPPPAPFSKSDIQSIGNAKMTLEERLKLMMLSDDGKSAAEQQRERRMRRAGARDRAGSPTPDPDVSVSNYGDEAEDTVGDISGLGDYQLPPRISRESIMRRADGNKALGLDGDYNFSSPPPSSSPERPLPADPDVPIPSTEDEYAEDSDESVIRHEVPESDIDIYDMYQSSGAPSEEPEERAAGRALEGGFADDETASQYSTQDPPEDPRPREADEEAAATPRATTPAQEPAQEPAPEPAAPAAEQQPAPAPAQAPAAEAEEKEPRNKLQPFALPRPDEAEAPAKVADAQAYLQRPYTPEQPLTSPDYDGSGWGEPEEYEDEPGTPESVIHHPMPPESPPLESPAVPEREATIKSASGSRLKTRPSATPSDISAMREARRQVSREVPDIPPIPERHRDRLSRDLGAEQQALSASTASDDYVDRHPSFKKRSLTLELDLGLSLDKDFERVIEAQKRGYLMRQNTKLVTASDKESDEPRRGARSAGSSPTKADRPQSWTVEPWNPQARKSIRKKSVMSGPAPPLPGQESNAAAVRPAAEEDAAAADVAADDSGERGRLFVKVMGVKDLDLPIPKNERTWFSLTLDNGVHCVTTAWLELARNAPIGQEFELVVPNDLEFQLTLNVKLERPPPQRVVPSPSKASKPKTSTFSRVFASPRRRKEMDLRQREEEERAAREQREAQARKMKAHPTAWDLLSPLAAEDGSFARAYISLKEHETRCYGRPYLVDIACFNEWATEEAGFASSVKSKRGTNAVVRRAPYKIGKLELQLLFVPRPRGAADDDMPKSMNSCIREMKAAEERLARNWEGHLSQQGGDCPYWRRRYFKLVGTKLTAYHEATRQPRATINLANAKRLIDDRAALTRKETTVRGGARRRSAFAEEEEGYMFVEEGFRIRFNNGEIIDFYADTAQDKNGWMQVLGEVIGRDSIGSNGGTGGDDDAAAAASRARGKWCELVFKREEALRRRAEGRRVHSRTKSSYV